MAACWPGTRRLPGVSVPRKWFVPAAEKLAWQPLELAQEASAVPASAGTSAPFGGRGAAASGDHCLGPLAAPPPGPFLCGGQQGRICSGFAIVVILMSNGTCAGVRRAALAALP